MRDVIAERLKEWPIKAPRDVDIGVAGLHKKLFAEVMKSYKAKPNRYGGYRLYWGNSPYWDIWRIEETVGLKKSTETKSVENVLRSFVLDCNAIAYDILRDRFLDLNARSSIVRGEISLLRNAILHDEPVFAERLCYVSSR